MFIPKSKVVRNKKEWYLFLIEIYPAWKNAKQKEFRHFADIRHSPPREYPLIAESNEVDPDPHHQEIGMGLMEVEVNKIYKSDLEAMLSRFSDPNEAKLGEKDIWDEPNTLSPRNLSRKRHSSTPPDLFDDMDERDRDWDMEF